MSADEHSPDPVTGPAAAFAGTVGRLTVLNATVTVLGIGTGILQARGLGPDGRGALAAIVVPLLLLGLLGDLGLGLFARREAARTAALGELLGTVGALVLAIGAVVGIALLPAVDLIARGREEVHFWLTVGLLLLPLTLGGNLLFNVAFGLERWELWIRARLVLSVGWLVALAGLYVAERLTVTTAAATYLALNLVAYVPLLTLLRRVRPFRVTRRLARDAVPFGARAWLASLTNLVNIRLDQLFMAGVVSSRELGLYAFAVTLASVPSNFSSAVALGVLPRVVRGGEELVPRTVRVSLAVVVVVGGVIAALAWPFVHVVIGREFEDALPMILVLLLAEVPLAGTVTLGQALIGAGWPGRTAAGEGLAVLVTLVGLVLVVPTFGGVGAAAVSLVAYTVSFAYLLVRSGNLFSRPVFEFVVFTAADVRWGIGEIRRLSASAASKRRSSRPA